MASWNPEAEGCHCSTCPLGPKGYLRGKNDPWQPVPPEIKEGSLALVVVQMPAETEESLGYPLAGDSGLIFNKATNIAKMDRTQLSIVHEVCCALPGKSHGAMDKIKVKLKQHRDNARKELIAGKYTKAEAERIAITRFPSPNECCRPQLIKHLSAFDNIIPLGGSSYTAVTGDGRTITRVRGGPQTREIFENGKTGKSLGVKKILPITSPGLVIATKKAAHEDMFTRDFGKARRFFTGKQNWLTAIPEADQAGLMEVCRDAAHLKEWLSGYTPILAIDCETIKTPEAGIRAGLLIDGLSPAMYSHVSNAEYDDPMFSVCDLVQLGSPALLADGTPTDDIFDILEPAPGGGVQKVPGCTYPRAIAIQLVLDRAPVFGRTELRKVVALLRWVIEGNKCPLAGTNLGAFDKQVFKANFNATLRKYRDHLFFARARTPDLPKGLKTQGTLFTDVSRWESTEKGEDSLDGPERVLYAQTDVIVDSWIDLPMRKAAEERGYFHAINPELRPANWDALFDSTCSAEKVRCDDDPTSTFNLNNIDHFRQAECVMMHEAGIWIDQSKVAYLTALYRQSVERREANLSGLLEQADVRVKATELVAHADESEADFDAMESEEAASVNIASANQFRDLLYEKWKLPKPPGMSDHEFYTDSDLPGTGNAVLLAHLAAPKGHLTQLQAQIINVTRLLRREKTKILGGLLRLVPKSLSDKGFIERNGRVHATYNAHVTAPGRLAASRPNTMNQGARKGQEQMQEIWAAPPGRLFVKADVDQFHIRIMSNKWGIKRYQRSFSEGIDPHIGLAHLIMEILTPGLLATLDGWEQCGGFSLKKKPKVGLAGNVRQVFKTAGYTMAYIACFDEKGAEAGAQLLTNVIRSTETGQLGADNKPVLDKLGIQKLSLPFINGYSSAETKTWLDLLFLGKDGLPPLEPEWLVAWQTAIDEYKANEARYGIGFTQSYYFGRPSGSLSGGKAQEIANSKILPSEADLMSLMEMSVITMIQGDWAKYNPQMVIQVHDSIGLEIDDIGPRCEGPRAHATKDEKKACPLCKWREARAEDLAQAMYLKVPGEEVDQTVESHWGYNMGAV